MTGGVRSPGRRFARIADRVVRIGAAVSVATAAHAVVNARLLRSPDPDAPAPAERISVLIPARDEAATIEACLRAVLAQSAADLDGIDIDGIDIDGIDIDGIDIEVVVLDDESTDDTAARAVSAAGGDPRVRVIRGRALPAGWIGKAHACAQLAELADPNSTVLVFVDADTVLAPNAVPAAVDLLRRTRLDLVSPVPRQVAGSLGERLVQPLLAWSWLATLPLRLAERSSRPSLSAAVGQFLVLDRAAYRRAGGHAAVRADVLDDIGLLRAVKRAGGHGGVVDGTGLATCRMYDGWSALRDGHSRWLARAFGTPVGAAAVVAAAGVVWVAPAVAALRGSRAGLVGYLAGVVGRAVAARRTGGRVLPDALAHPVSVLVFGWLTGRSAYLRRTGRIVWRGRDLSR